MKCVKPRFHDHGYVEGIRNWRTKNEIVSLAVVATVASGAVLSYSKGMSLAALYSAANYYYIHRRTHLEPDWAVKKIPWHYDHHMNSNQDANWCVTKPWFDYILGTRVISSQELQEQNPLGISFAACYGTRFKPFVGCVFSCQVGREKSDGGRTSRLNGIGAHDALN